MKQCINKILLTGLSTIFIFAGIIKMSDILSFFLNIKSYHLLSEQSAWYLANYLPYVEIVAGTGLIFKRTREASALIMVLLLSTFIFANVLAFHKGIDIQCGCFGANNGISKPAWTLIRDITMLLSSLYLLKTKFPSSSKKSSPATTVRI